jgi:uncharacterized protein YdeI (YjbR/CyaY-like superfamily)
MKPRHFSSAAEFRRWLAEHGATRRELWVGFYKKASGRTGMSYQEAVDEALCAGWIDGLIKRVDDDSYMHRFTPRTASSIWSAVNLKRIKALIAARRVTKAGLAVYEGRDPKRAGLYSFEKPPEALSPALEKRFRADPRAWTFFNAQPPGYRRLCLHFVMSARKEETRLRRLDMLIKSSSSEQRLTWM